MELNIALAHEAVAAAVPDRECIVWRDRRLTWAAVAERTRRLANVLAGAGLGAHGDPAAAAPWESAQDLVALYLTNSNEYLEGMVGAYKARAVPFNVNYRYVAEELAYLFRDARPRAVVFHERFAPVLAEVLAGSPAPPPVLLLQVADGSGHGLLDGAVHYEAALASAGAAPLPDVDPSPDDLYVVYTGGTTGMPKGAAWRQADFLVGALGIRRRDGSPFGSYEELSGVAEARGANLRSLVAPPLMHGAAHWNAISCFLSGGTVVMQDHPDRLEAADLLGTIARERCTSVSIVGDAFARPILDELARASYDVSSWRHVVTGGAVLSPANKRALAAAVPRLAIIDIVGSSESGRQGMASGTATGAFTADGDACVLAEDLSGPLLPGHDGVGWLARSGPMPRGYLGDPEKTARTFPTVGGVRYVVAGDRARLLAGGRIELLGRDSVTINTGGEKVFAEEVELALKDHPAVVDVLVVPRPSERWGQEVVAVVAVRDPVTDGELDAVARRHLAGYKVPKAYVRVPAVERSASGKPDYAWARRQVTGQ